MLKCIASSNSEMSNENEYSSVSISFNDHGSVLVCSKLPKTYSA